MEALVAALEVVVERRQLPSTRRSVIKRLGTDYDWRSASLERLVTDLRQSEPRRARPHDQRREEPDVIDVLPAETAQCHPADPGGLLAKLDQVTRMLAAARTLD